MSLVRHGQSGPKIHCRKCLSPMMYEYVTGTNARALLRACWSCGVSEHVVVQRMGGLPIFPYHVRDFDREWFSMVSNYQPECPHVEERRDQPKPAIHLPGSPAFNTRRRAFQKRFRKKEEAEEE